MISSKHNDKRYIIYVIHGGARMNPNAAAKIHRFGKVGKVVLTILSVLSIIASIGAVCGDHLCSGLAQGCRKGRCGSGGGVPGESGLL